MGRSAGPGWSGRAQHRHSTAYCDAHGPGPPRLTSLFPAVGDGALCGAGPLSSEALRPAVQTTLYLQTLAYCRSVYTQTELLAPDNTMICTREGGCHLAATACRHCLRTQCSMLLVAPRPHLTMAGRLCLQVYTAGGHGRSRRTTL